MQVGMRAAVMAVLLWALVARGEPDFAAIDAYVSEQMAAHGIPGLALVIVQDGKPVHLRGFGVAGPQDKPATPQTPFLLGSLSKAFTAVAVMQQVEAGRLELDAPVQRYLPWFRVADPKASAAITVRHLLHHTSGLPTQAERARGEGLTLEDHVRVLANVELASAPGERHEYSSPNYIVLGLLVEHASGEPFARYVERHLFQPLGMTRSSTSEEAARAHGLAVGHRLWAGLPFPMALHHEPDRLPTASLIASAEDLSRFLVAQMAGAPPGAPTLLSRDSLAALHAPGASGEGFAYAMGWRVGTTAGAPSLWHGGALPGYRGAMVLQPEERWGVVVLSNLGSYFEDTTRLIARGVTARLRGLPAPEEGYPLRHASLAMIAAMVLPLGWTAWRLARLERWWSRVSPRLATRGGRRRQVLWLTIDLLVPVLVLGLLPRLMGVTLAGLFESIPDLGMALLALLLSGGLVAALRLRRVLRAASP